MYIRIQEIENGYVVKAGANDYFIENISGVVAKVQEVLEGETERKAEEAKIQAEREQQEQEMREAQAKRAQEKENEEN